VLTKPLGTGLIGHAIRRGTAAEPSVRDALAHMLALNDKACQVGLETGATACTDVTGYGLLGHLKQMVEAAGLRATVRAAAVPLLEGALELAAADCVPGGTRRNLQYASDCTSFDAQVDETLRLVLADAQTSGGLLLCLPASRAAEAVDRLREGGGERAALIGELAEADQPAIHVT
jgi:selenide,water dikinase